MQSLGSVQHIATRPLVGQRPRSSGRNPNNVPVVNAKKGDEEAPSNNSFLSMFAPASGSGTMRFFAGGDKKSAGDKQGGAQSFFSAFAAPQGGKSASAANTVFVAGSTGRLGIRVVRELLAAGYNVRAGVRSQEKAEAFPEILDDLNEIVGPLSRQELNRVKVVFCDLNEPDTIAPAIGNASRIVCCVGAAESEFTNLAAPKLIDFEGTVRLINAAAKLDIQQFILVTSLGTGKFGFPAGILNIFGGVLIWKRKAEEALEASGMPYLIVRPGGMERPKDDHKETHNVRLQKRDTLFGGTVSRLQIAELIAAAVANPEVAENKTVEVVAETKAPSVEYAALLSNERTEIVQEAREERLEEVRAIRGELSQAQDALEESKEKLDSVRKVVSELQSTTAAARAAAKEAQKEQGAVVKEAEKAEATVEKLRREAEQAAREAAAAKAVAAEGQRAVRESRVLTRQEIAEIRASVLNPPLEKESNTPEETNKPGTVSGFFGTIIKQAVPAAAVVEEEEEEEEEVAESKKAVGGLSSMLSGFFGGAQRQAAAVVEEEEEEEEEQVAPTAASPKEQAKGFLGGISSFFQPQGTVYADEEVSTEQRSSDGAAMKAAREARATAAGAPAAPAAPAAAPVQEEAAASTPAAAASTPAAAASMPKMPEFKMPAMFGGFGMQKEEQEEEKESTAAASVDNEAEAAAARAEADAAAAQAEAQAKAQAEAEEAAAAQAKAEAEAAAAAKAKEEEEQAASAAAAKAEEERVAGEAAAAAKAKAEEEKRVAAEAKEREAASAAIAAENAKQARAWIESWRSRPVPTSAAAAPAAAPDTDDSEVPANVQEAKAWIDAWKAKSQS